MISCRIEFCKHFFDDEGLHVATVDYRKLVTLPAVPGKGDDIALGRTDGVWDAVGVVDHVGFDVVGDACVVVVRTEVSDEDETEFGDAGEPVDVFAQNLMKAGFAVAVNGEWRSPTCVPQG